MARVLCKGCTAGAARLATMVAAPDSGMSSSQDSSGAWSGRIQSASALVSSRKLEKLTMKGTLAAASRIRAAGGAEKTGLALYSINTFGVFGELPSAF